MSSVSNVHSTATLETDVCSLLDPATIEPRKLHKEKKQSLNSHINQDKEDSKPQDHAGLPIKGSLSICSALWDNYAYFLLTYWSVVTFKRSYSDAN